MKDKGMVGYALVTANNVYTLAEKIDKGIKEGYGLHCDIFMLEDGTLCQSLVKYEQVGNKKLQEKISRLEKENEKLRDINLRMKFRVWDNKDECWAKGFFTMYQDGSLANNENYHVSDITDNRFSCTFSTGIKDKNGKEIYAGDIVLMHQFLFDGEEVECELCGLVVYNNKVGAFGLNNIKSDWFEKYTGFEPGSPESWTAIGDFYGMHDESFNVIGNIYENPELLRDE